MNVVWSTLLTYEYCHHTNKRSFGNLGIGPDCLLVRVQEVLPLGLDSRVPCSFRQDLKPELTKSLPCWVMGYSVKISFSRLNEELRQTEQTSLDGEDGS